MITAKDDRDDGQPVSTEPVRASPPAAAADPIELELSAGAEARNLLCRPEFQAKLQRLFERCPWATGFQSGAFVSTWYRCYADAFDPIVVFQSDGERLTGFLALASDKRRSRIVAAGDHQAEYQCWLAEPDRSDAFLQAALALLVRRYAPERLTFKYLPAEAPVAWAETTLECGARVRLRPHRRPILGLTDPARIHKSLNKKSNRSRLNRLRQLGEIRLRRLANAAELENAIDSIADQYDFRQGAINGVSPFREDPNKRRFYLDMMDSPGLQHAAVLSVGDRIAAAHLGLADGDRVVLGVYAHAPSLARHSPGKILMLTLAGEFASEGIQGIDLTPGGAWKDRFATEHDQVFEVVIFFNRAAAVRERAIELALAATRRALAMAGLTPTSLRRFARPLRKASPSRLMRRAKAILWQDREYRIYFFDTATAPAPVPKRGFARDRIADLLCFEPSEPWHGRQAFLADCEARLARGNHVYTYVEEGRLLHYGWLVDSQREAFFPEVAQHFTYPDDTAVLYDFFTMPGARGRGLYQQCLKTMLHAAGSAEHVAIAVLADNTASRHVIEKLGFRHEASLFQSRRFGIARRWRSLRTSPKET